MGKESIKDEDRQRMTPDQIYAEIIRQKTDLLAWVKSERCDIKTIRAIEQSLNSTKDMLRK